MMATSYVSFCTTHDRGGPAGRRMDERTERQICHIDYRTSPHRERRNSIEIASFNASNARLYICEMKIGMLRIVGGQRALVAHLQQWIDQSIYYPAYETNVLRFRLFHAPPTPVNPVDDGCRSIIY